MPSPSFQFYPDDFVGSGTVQAADPDEIGAYVLLLCLDWGEVGFAFDERRLAKVCRLNLKRFRYVWGHLAPKFPARDGRHYNPRLEKERQKQAEWHAKSVAGGIASAAKRGKGGAGVVARVVEPEHQPSGNTPDSRLQTPTPELQRQPQQQLLGTPSQNDREGGPTDGPTKPAKVTWLTPIGAAWEAVYDAGSFPWKQAARELAPLRTHHTSEEIARRLAWYLENKGSETVLPPDQLARKHFTPSLKDFRLRFGAFDPSKPSAL